MNKFVLIGILVVILITIPVTLFLIKQQQDTRSGAQAATTLSLLPATKSDVRVGDEFTLDVQVDPGGVNVVSNIRLQLSYDTTILELVEIAPQDPFTTTTEGLQVGSDSASINFGIGQNITSAIQTATVAAKVTFKALAITDSPTTVSFDTTNSSTRVLSLATTDGVAENVLSAAQPATISILEGDGEEEPSITPTVTDDPDPTVTEAPDPTVTQTPPTVTQLPNQAPLCTALGADRDLTGSAPLSIAFTASGNDPDGTITKVSFNFGDGPVQESTSGSGIGTNAVSLQVAHTYNNPGTYTVSATLTDDDGAMSNPATCSKTVTVQEATTGGDSGGDGGNTGGGSTPATPTPNLQPGATATTWGIIGGVILTVVGGMIFFLL